MSATTGKEYKLAIRIAGIVDKSFNASLSSVNNTLRGNLLKVDASFQQLDKGFDRILRGGQRVFRAVATAAGVASAAIAAASIAAIKVGMDFERQMSTVEAISGATASEMEQLTEKARELGRTTVFSATEVGSAMEYMGMAGWKTEEMLEGIDGVLDLAAASGEDLARVSDIVTDNLTAFHLTASDTTKMVDAMAQAAMNSNTNIDKMGESFKYAGAVMGSTFEASGTQFEDTAIAIGLMANNGIKASIAGTALRNMITRMVKPTKESQTAIDRLGISLQDEEGNMYSFLEVMKQLREGFSGISDTVEKESIAAMLGGQRGMNGLLAIADATDEQFNELTEAIYNSAGAAEKMAGIRLDNLSGDVELFKDAIKDLGIEIFQQNDGPLRDIVQRGTKIVTGLSKKIPEALTKVSKKVNAELPKIKNTYNKYIKPIIDFLGKALKWLLSHGQMIISILAGIGLAMASYKVASSATHFITSLMSLASNPVGLAIVGIATAIGAVTTALAAYAQHERELIDQNLADHFGSVSLTMEEISQAVEHILGAHTMLKASVEEFSKLDGIAKNIGEANDVLNKLDWKVSIGMELSEEDKESYKSAIDTFVSQMQEYVIQQNYSVNLGMTAGMSADDLADTNIIDRLNSFYADNYGELQQLGQELSAAVTDAFSDGLLDFDESQKIQEIKQKMANIQQAIALDENQVTFKTLELKAAGGDLTADSFKALMTELVSSATEVQNMLDETNIRNQMSVDQLYESELTKAKELFNAGKISLREFQQTARDLEAQHATDSAALASKYSEDIVANTSKVMTFGLNTITNQYSQEIAAAGDPIRQGLEDLLGGIDPQEIINGTAQLPQWGGFLNNLFNTLTVNSGSDLIDDTSKKAMMELLDQMAPTVEDMQATRDKCLEAGKEVPKAIMDGINQYTQLELMASGGDIDGLYTYLGSIIAENPEYQAVLTAMQSQGTHIPEELSTAIDANKSAVGAGAAALYSATGTELNNLFSAGFDVTVPVRLQYAVSGDTSGIAAAAQAGANSIGAANNASGGIYTGGPFLSWLNEKGPEAIIPLDGSRNATELWKTTGDILGQQGSPLDDIEIGGGSSSSSEMMVNFSPVQNFYGGAPNKADLAAANKESFNQFKQFMAQYNKENRRTAFSH